MNLFYLVGSLAGVALLVGLNLLLFGRVHPAIATAQQAADAVSALVPGFQPADVAVSGDGAALLVSGRAGEAIYLVAARGTKVVARPLTSRNLRQVSRNGDTLTLRMADFTFPRAKLSLPDARIAADWEARLEAIVS